MSAVLIAAWVVLGIGGGFVAGWELQMRHWTTGALAALAMCVGIACGITAF